MATWREKFGRLSEVEREAIENWKVNGNASNLVIHAKESTNAFLIRYQQAGCAPHDDEMPDI